MLEMNFETNGAPFFTCTVKFGDKTESFCYIDCAKVSKKESLKPVLEKAVGIAGGKPCFIHIESRQEYWNFVAQGVKTYTGSFKVNGVAATLKYFNDKNIGGELQLINSVANLFNISRDKKSVVVKKKIDPLAMETYGGNYIKAWFNEDTVYEVLGSVNWDYDKKLLTISYKNGRVVVLSDFAVVDSYYSARSYESISQEEFDHMKRKGSAEMLVEEDEF